MELVEKSENKSVCDSTGEKHINKIADSEEIKPNNLTAKTGVTSESSPANHSNTSFNLEVKFESSSQVDMFLDKFIKPEIKNWTSLSRHNLKRRASRRQLSLNVLIVGEPGLGQKTFIETLVTNNSLKKDTQQNTSEEPDKMVGVDMEEKSYILIKDGQRIILNLINVKDYGCGLNNNSTFSNILDYVNATFMDCFKLECSLDRISTEDKKIHCCLYFISPYGHSLKPLDIEFMKIFQKKFNIIPIIPKSDSFTRSELEIFRKNILTDFEKYNIKLFQSKYYSESIDNDLEDTDELLEDLKGNIPFSIVTSKISTTNNKKLEDRVRQYPWGTLKTQDLENNNYSFLETILLKSHLNYLRLTTKYTFYENFRMQYILDHVN